jgi:branched-chain amino acid transport system permease protein
MSNLIEILISAGEAGCIYALVALAYYLVLRPTGIINFASGDLAMLGGMAGVAFSTWLELPFLAAAAISVTVVGLVSLLTERLLVRRLTAGGAPLAAIILALLGVMFVYRETAALIFGLDVLQVDPPFGYGTVDLAGFGIPAHTFLIYAATTVVFVGAWCFFERTLAGKAFRAVAIDRLGAGLVGINLSVVSTVSFFAAGAVAALAGLLQAPLTSAHFLAGLALTIKGFTVLVIGGVGRVEAIILGAMMLSLCEKLALRYLPIPSGYILGIPLLVLILFLVFRPHGLFGERAA